MSLTREVRDAFNFFINNHFEKEINRKIENKSYDFHRGVFIDLPKIANQHPLKLHISLEFSAFEQHKKQIEVILCEHISEIVAREKSKGDFRNFYYRFKYIDSDTLIPELILSEKLTPLLEKYQKWLEEKQVGYFDTENLLRLLKQFYNDEKLALPNLKDTRKILTVENRRFTTSLRFIACDQFTIYFPSLFVIDDVVALSKKIDNYLKLVNAKPGLITPGATKVTDHMNLRLEYLDDSNKRLDAIFLCPTDADFERRKRAVALQRQSPLYKALCETFSVRSDFSANSIFTQQTSNGAAQSATPSEMSYR